MTRFRLAIPDYLLRLPPAPALAAARELGLDGLELGVGGEELGEHPLLTGDGPADLQQQAAEHGVALAAASAGFLSRMGLVAPDPLARQRAAERTLALLAGCRQAGIEVLHLPCYGPSEPRTAAERHLLVEVLRPLAAQADQHGVVLALDTLLPADEAQALADSLRSPRVRLAVNVGNARAAGRDVIAELKLLAPRLSQVRLKDRARREPFASVPFGQGTVDLRAVVQALAAASYDGWLVLDHPSQDEPLPAAQRSIAYVRGLMTTNEPLSPPSAPEPLHGPRP